jgi:hypothetical protein
MEKFILNIKSKYEDARQLFGNIESNYKYYSEIKKLYMPKLVKKI